MNLRQWRQRVNWLDLGLVLVGLALAVLLRVSVIGFESRDFELYSKVWYVTLQQKGFSAFSTGFYDYTPLYLYSLYLTSVLLPNLSPVVAVKLTAIVSDGVCAWLVYKLVRLKYPMGALPLFAFFAVLFAPTVVLNSSMWGQTDSLYTAAFLACIYFIMSGHETAAMIAFGFAPALKPQAAFLVPWLVAIWLRRQVSLKSFIWIPIVYLLTLVPAWLAGRPLGEMLTVYTSQTGDFLRLTENAPNVYAWLPHNRQTDDLYLAALVGAMSVTLLYLLVVRHSRAKLSPPILLQTAMVCLVLLPFVLPRMHERYFYPAEILAISYAFFFSAYFWVPVAISLISFFVYVPYLFKAEVLPLPVLATALLVVVVAVVRHMMLSLYRPPDSRPIANCQGAISDGPGGQ